MLLNVRCCFRRKPIFLQKYADFICCPVFDIFVPVIGEKFFVMVFLQFRLETHKVVRQTEENYLIHVIQGVLNDLVVVFGAIIKRDRFSININVFSHFE